jgi:phosphoribosylamine--glycine ligase
VICESAFEALAEFDLMIQRAKFGEASKKVVVEEFLKGIELSVFVLSDGKIISHCRKQRIIKE